MLTQNLWIDISPYYEINYPSKIKIWDDIKDGVFFTFYIGNISGFDDLKTFIPEYLDQYLTKEIIKDQSELVLMKSILNLLL